VTKPNRSKFLRTDLTLSLSLGLVIQGYNGAQRDGVIGLLKGIGRGIVGLPVKPIGGLFDFAAKTLEGMLHSMGTGYTTQTRIHEPVEVCA
jgi:hypothetical protein